MQVICLGGNLHEMQNLFSGKDKNVTKCCLLNFVHGMLSNKVILRLLLDTISKISHYKFYFLSLTLNWVKIYIKYSGNF